MVRDESSAGFSSFISFTILELGFIMIFDIVTSIEIQLHYHVYRGI